MKLHTTWKITKIDDERERNNEQEYRDGIMEDVFYFSINSAFCNLSYYGVEVKFKANKKNTKSYKKKVP